ncbi:MAG: guanylate kinase [Patescibacteria group bacterium]
MKYKHVALVAVSGTGKGTVSSYLFDLIPGLCLSISATTRSPRQGEVDGKHYYFLTRKKFIEKINNNEFAEWFEYNGNLYGTLMSEVKRIENEGGVILFDIEINGAMALKKSLGEKVVCVFLEAPIEVCEARLRGRNTESEEYIQGRLKIGREVEIPRKKECDFIVPYGEGADPGFTAHHVANLMIAA